MTCENNCRDCTCQESKNKTSWSDQIYTDTDIIWDESGFPIGAAARAKSEIFLFSDIDEPISYKYAEDKILADLKEHLDKTYTEHYMTENQSIECFDAWIALGDSTPTFRNTALKYLWRYGKKNGSNKKDLMKALHYIFMCLYVDHYKKDEK